MDPRRREYLNRLSKMIVDYEYYMATVGIGNSSQPSKNDVPLIEKKWNWKRVPSTRNFFLVLADEPVGFSLTWIIR